MISCEIVVTGKVQGVGFRRFVLNLAHQFNISGYVKNRYSRDVYILATGDSDSIELFIHEISKGNFFSRVDNITSFEIPLEKDHEGFEIRWTLSF